MVWRAFLWLLAGYFAVIGLVQAAAWVVGILFPPKVPKGCRLILAVEEDADYTESGLHGCCPGRRRRGRSAGGTAGTGILRHWNCSRPKNGV